MLRDKVLAELRFVTTGDENYLGVVKNVNDFFLSLIVPKNLDGNHKDNVAIQFNVGFEELCAALKSNGMNNPKKMTVFEFYATLKYFEERNRKHNPHESNSDSPRVSRPSGKTKQ